MRVQARAHWEPKAGSHASEYEDAYWPTHVADDALVDDFCCAVADGATESSYSRMWAKQLAQAACHKHWLDETALTRALAAVAATVGRACAAAHAAA
ncbi:MAG: hypothetical protein HC853_15525 [Anaerolineae bacterium]|nr:hypothetical protein [Anaerolineae bacterium]